MTLRDSLCVVAGALALGCAVAGSAPSAARAPDPASDDVLVQYPAGDCTAELEIEIYERGAGAWRPHPRHARLALGACALEAPGRLLNELRVRCVDPLGRRAPSEWVVGASPARSAAPCVGPVAR